MVNKDKLLFTPVEVVDVLTEEVKRHRDQAVTDKNQTTDTKVQERLNQAIIFFEKYLILSIQSLEEQVSDGEIERKTITNTELLFGLMQLLEIICLEASAKKKIDEIYVVNPHTIITFFTALRTILKV